jgi:hypothetical protein
MEVVFATNFPEHIERIGGKPTNFKPKLWQGFAQLDLNNLMEAEYLKYLLKLSKEDIDLIGHVGSKITTIRRDKENLYHPGTVIEFYDDAGNELAPPMKCVSTQGIYIKWFSRYGDWMGDTLTFVDSIALRGKEVELIAQNDGFDRVEDFFTYFNKDFKGKIIHWTNLKY